MSTETTEKLRPLLTDEEIADLSRARTILKQLGARCQKRAISRWVDGYIEDAVDPHDFGLIQAFSEQAESAVFGTIVRVRHHGQVDMTDEQLYNAAPEQDEVEGHRVLDTRLEEDWPTDRFQGESPTEHDWRL